MLDDATGTTPTTNGAQPGLAEAAATFLHHPRHQAPKPAPAARRSAKAGARQAKEDPVISLARECLEWGDWVNSPQSPPDVPGIIHDHMSEMEARIAATPATTMAGVAAKLRLLQDGEWRGDYPAKKNTVAPPDELYVSALRDAERLAQREGLPVLKPSVRGGYSAEVAAEAEVMLKLSAPPADVEAFGIGTSDIDASERSSDCTSKLITAWWEEENALLLMENIADEDERQADLLVALISTPANSIADALGKLRIAYKTITADEAPPPTETYDALLESAINDVFRLHGMRLD